MTQTDIPIPTQDTTLTAIVVSYYTGPCLQDALYILLGERAINEIVVVNNGNSKSVTKRLDALTSRYNRLKHIEGHGNIGYGAGINLGTKASKADYFLIINPDALMIRGSVHQLLAAHQSDPKAGLIGGHLFDKSGQAMRGARRCAPKWAHALGLRQWMFHNEPIPEHSIPMPVISGAFFLISRALFEELNGFDEGYFLHFEDIDICVRATEAGYQNYFTPKASALHYGSTAKIDPKSLRAHKADSLQKYFTDHAQSRIDKALNAALLPFACFFMRRFGAPW